MLAMITTDRAPREANIDGGLVLSVHGELAIEVPEDRADEASALLKIRPLARRTSNWSSDTSHAALNGFVSIRYGHIGQASMRQRRRRERSGAAPGAA